MRLILNSHLRSFSLLALLALALSACAPATAIPTAAPPPSATPLPTALPPSATPAVPATATLLPGANPATSVGLEPSDVAFDSAGNMYVSACGCVHDGAELYKMDPFGLLTAFASPVSGDVIGDGGSALSAQINHAVAVAVDRDDNVYVADQYNNRIRRIDRDGIITTVAGGGPGGFGGNFLGDGGPAVAASLNAPSGIDFDADGNLYIVDTGHNLIRRVDPQGIITTIAGTGFTGFSGDGGPATAADLYINIFGGGPSGIAVDAAGNVYFSDAGNLRVRKIDPLGIITTVAGNGQPSYAGDGGPATAAQFNGLAGLAVEADGSLYISDATTIIGLRSRVRKVDPQGIITTVTGGIEGDFAGDGGPATAATVRDPWGLALDSAGNLYIADNGSGGSYFVDTTSIGRVRRVDRSGTITTVVGGVP